LPGWEAVWVRSRQAVCSRMTLFKVGVPSSVAMYALVVTVGYGSMRAIGW